MTIRAVLSLGSNLGDRERTLRDAVREISALPGTTVLAASGLVQTPALKPEGVDVAAPAYLNAAVILSTEFTPEQLLDALNAVEQEHGRVRIERWGDRTLDIDIVSVAGVAQATERLTLPHPRAFERGFVLVPWLQVEPDAELPGLGRVDALPASKDPDVQRFESKGLL
jgi:2-amino-4-hydroxy-6-hydroxymethyldihydropteridine diphosphokinase